MPSSLDNLWRTLLKIHAPKTSARFFEHFYELIARARRPPAMRIVLISVGLLTTLNAVAQKLDPITDWATTVSHQTSLSQNVVYHKANSVDLKLDVIAMGSSVPRPVVIYFHGGGWVIGSKEGTLLKGLPYLARGMDFVNVEYRLASQSLAPAAVEDCRCALRWVAQHAKDYGFDPSKIVVTGESAGGHLALMTGMVDGSAGFDRECEQPATKFQPGLPDQWSSGTVTEIKVAAIIDLFGVTDVADLMQGPNKRNHAERWVGDVPNSMELAKRLSPLTYARKDLPPILIIHGDQDPVVPYEQAVRLHQALEHAGARVQLTPIIGGGHGSTPPFAWTHEQYVQAQEAAFGFLEKYGILQH
jgi:acetyl esterase/lipase